MPIALRVGIILETSVGCEKDVQDIAVQRKFSKFVLTLLGVSAVYGWR